MKSSGKRRCCSSCSKTLSCQSSLCRHKKVCKNNAANFVRMDDKLDQDRGIKLTLKWNGKFWETKNTNFHYQINLGRDLANLLQRGAIKEDALNSTQKDYVQMYKSLFWSLRDKIDAS